MPAGIPGMPGAPPAAEAAAASVAAGMPEAPGAAAAGAAAGAVDTLASQGGTALASMTPSGATTADAMHNTGISSPMADEIGPPV